MAKKKSKKEEKNSLEDKFVVACKKANLEYISRLFAAGDGLFLPDFVFKNMIVDIEECISVKKLENIKRFRKHYPEFKLYLLTNDQSHCLEAAKEFDEVFDLTSIDLLLKEIRKGLDNKPK